MRKSLWIIAVLFVAMGAPIAHAQTFNADFTCAACAYVPIPTNNPITFPLTSGADILDFTYDGYAASVNLMTGGAGDITYGDTITWGIAENETQYFINIYDNGGYSQSTGFSSAEGIGAGEDGPLTFAPATAVTPEPSTASLMLIGLGSFVAMMVMRKRSARGLFQSS